MTSQPTFQQNVRATFYWRTFSKKASVPAIAVTFGTGFAVAGGATNPFSTAIAYTLLLDMVVLIGVVFYLTTKPQVNLFRGSDPWFGIRDVWRPMLLGVALTLSAYVIVLYEFGFPLASRSASQNVRNVLLGALFVGFVEEYMRWTWLQTLPYGVLSANALWVLLHPEVAPILNGQAWSPFFAVVALGFGFFATALMWLWDTLLPYGLNRWLGVILAATLHAGYNALVIIWQVQVVVPGVGQVAFGPMMIAPVAVIATISIYPTLWAMTRWRLLRQRRCPTPASRT